MSDSPGNHVHMTSPDGPDMRTARRRNVLRWVAAGLALAGWYLSFELTARSFGQRTLGLSAVLCSAKDDPKADDCRSVQNSAWGSIPISNREGAPRMPVGVLGMGYFAAVALWLVFVGAPSRDRWFWHAGVFAICAVSAFYSFDFLRVMSVVLRQWCAACAAVHVINFALLGSMILLFPFGRRAAGGASTPTAPLALAALTSGLLVFALQFVAYAGRLADLSYKPLQEAYLKISRDPEFARWHFQRQTPIAIPLDRAVPDQQPSDQFEGPADARNMLVVFSDFQCSACLRAHKMIREILRDSPGSLRVLYRHFPLNSSCNPEAESARHPAACRAARAAIAAHAIGGNSAAAKMRDLLFERQASLVDADLESWSTELGLDRVAFRVALDSQGTNDALAADIAIAKSAGVTTTPTLFLNGRRFDHWMEPATWRALLDEDRKSASQEATR